MSKHTVGAAQGRVGKSLLLLLLLLHVHHPTYSIYMYDVIYACCRVPRRVRTIFGGFFPPRCSVPLRGFYISYHYIRTPFRLLLLLFSIFQFLAPPQSDNSRLSLYGIAYTPRSAASSRTKFTGPQFFTLHRDGVRPNV